MPISMRCPRAKKKLFLNISRLMFLSHFSQILENLSSKKLLGCFHITIDYFITMLK